MKPDPVKLKKQKPICFAQAPVQIGVAKKPDYCLNSCWRGNTCSGFVPDTVPESPRVGILLPKPTKESALESKALAGGLGDFFWYKIADPAGLKERDVLISHVLRCYSSDFPVGEEAKKAKRACRYWDDYFRDYRGYPATGRGLCTWEPNLFIPTFEPLDCIKTGAMLALAVEDFRKAVRFSDRGFRPLLLLGQEALKLMAPWLPGGVKRWRGHYWVGEYRWYVEDQEQQVPTYKKLTTRIKKLKAVPLNKNVKQLTLFGE
jgi:hypothetical protein